MSKQHGVHCAYIHKIHPTSRAIDQEPSELGRSRRARSRPTGPHDCVTVVTHHSMPPRWRDKKLPPRSSCKRSFTFFFNLRARTHNSAPNAHGFFAKPPSLPLIKARRAALILTHTHTHSSVRTRGEEEIVKAKPDH